MDVNWLFKDGAYHAKVGQFRLMVRETPKGQWVYALRYLDADTDEVEPLGGGIRDSRPEVEAQLFDRLVHWQLRFEAKRV